MFEKSSNIIDAISVITAFPIETDFKEIYF